MRLGDHVVRFAVDGIRMIGNTRNGLTAGLTQECFDLCERLLREDVPVEEIDAIDPYLRGYLENGGFVEGACYRAKRSAYVHVTDRCNFSCIGCYSLDERRNSCDDPSTEEVFAIMKDLALGGVTDVVISGGEPFLRDDLPDIARHAKAECGIESIAIATNGSFADFETLAQLSSFVDLISVSIDGFSENAISYVRKDQVFDALMTSIERIKGCGIPVRLTPTIHARNAEHVENFVALARTLGVGLKFSLLSPSSCQPLPDEVAFDDSSLRLLGRSLARSGCGMLSYDEGPGRVRLSAKSNCGAGCRTIGVSSTGRVHPCHMLHSERFSYDSTECMDAHRSYFEQTAIDVVDECRSCEYRYLCGGGCRARAFSLNGDYFDKDPYCALIKEYYSCYFSFLKESLSRQGRR